MIELKLHDQTVRIDAGELVSYQVGGHEFVHQKGSPGWRNADTEMFPVIGPTNEADFRVATLKGKAVQDQHGLLREMAYELLEHSETKAVFSKKYDAHTEIKNSKFPNKSTEEKLSWPYDFLFIKSFELRNRELQIGFEVNGEEGMPFMLGYHPAFKLTSENASIKTNTKEISIPEIIAVGSRALQVPNHSQVILKDKRNLRITAVGFEHFMLWTEVSNMVCIEPITFYPYAVEQKNLHEGFQKLGNQKRVFQVTLEPL